MHMTTTAEPTVADVVADLIAEGGRPLIVDLSRPLERAELERAVEWMPPEDLAAAVAFARALLAVSCTSPVSP